MHASKAPFLLHALIETAAALSFILKPESQLPRREVIVAARLVLRSLGGLLLSTNLICLVFVARPGFDGTARLVAASLAFWHVWPCHRAYVRIVDPAVDADRDGDGEGEGDEMRRRGVGGHRPPAKTFGGPAVHLVVHGVLFLTFVAAALVG